MKGRVDILREQHECNAWCRGEEHCDTFYSSTESISKATTQLEKHLGITIRAIEPAREPKLLDVDDIVSLMSGNPSSGGKRFPLLIRWTFPEATDADR